MAHHDQVVLGRMSTRMPRIAVESSPERVKSKEKQRGKSVRRGSEMRGGKRPKFIDPFVLPLTLISDGART